MTWLTLTIIGSPAGDFSQQGTNYNKVHSLEGKLQYFTEMSFERNFKNMVFLQGPHIYRCSQNRGTF